jgi:hypothetical protein
MMLLLSLLNTDTPVELFLKRCVEVQKMQVGRSISVVQNCILHELRLAAKDYESGKRDNPEVSLVGIRDKYKLNDYTVHRNAQMLSSGGTRNRKGKGWIKSAIVKKEEKDNQNLRAIVLSKRGREIAEILFN